MIGLDTNILVRYITQDDIEQSRAASRIMDELTIDRPGFVSMITVVELVWVLARCYHSDKTEICSVLEGLLRTRELMIDQAETIWKALRLFKNTNADFADCLIERSGFAAGCEYTVTFDKGAVKNCGMRLAD